MTNLSAQKQMRPVVHISETPVRYRNPSRAKVMMFARVAFHGTAASDSELVSRFATSVQLLLIAYTRSLNNTEQTNSFTADDTNTSLVAET